MFGLRDCVNTQSEHMKQPFLKCLSGLFTNEINSQMWDAC